LSIWKMCLICLESFSHIVISLLFPKFDIYTIAVHFLPFGKNHKM
jgi:hypothetical protein